MEQKIALQIIGLIVLISGFVLTYNPELVSNKPIPEDTFRAIERRVWWGLLIGFGSMLIFHQQIKPCFLTMAVLCITLTSGVLISRLMGIFLDGSVPRQWMWVAVEVVMIIVFAIWYLKQKP